jgi:hypothetical protein
MGGPAVCCGLHTAQVHQSCRTGHRPVQVSRGWRPMSGLSTD